MKVAIIGAGISGLACACELERHGIRPTIFERKDFTGDILFNSAAMLNLFNRSHKDPIDYFRQNYDFNIKPLYPVREVIMTSPKNEAVIKGDLGYIFARGREVYSLENQLVQYLKVPIQLGSQLGVSDAKSRFDYVVAATGEDSCAKALNAWTQVFNALVRVAVVIGKFKTDRIKMWMNTHYAKNGYCYLIPNNERQANLIMIVNEITYNDLDFYWKEFLMNVEMLFPIIETRDFEFNLGSVSPVRVDNVFLVGNAGGFIDDVLGFGTFGAIESGILAARSIAEGFDYTKLTQPLTKRIAKLHEFRKAINQFGNSNIDSLVSAMDSTGMKKLTYSNPKFRITHATFAAKLFNSLNRKE